jgi:hypothetical protein
MLGAGPAVAQQELPLPPQPEIDIDNRDKYRCKEKELEYEPVASYRVSGMCEITDIKGVGEYEYGIRQVKSEIPRFQSEETVKRFVHGESVYRKQVQVELHRALERTATLVCETDMMESQVFNAKIIRTREDRHGELKRVEEPVAVEDQRLPDLGVFTHSRTVTYKTNRCDGDA